MAVGTTDGDFVVKVANNPAGPRVLANDWVGTRLAGIIGVPTPEPMIVEVPPGLVMELRPGLVAAAGPAFGSRFEDGNAWGGEASTRGVANADVFSRLVVLDTWILNVDRYSVDESGRVRRNVDNLFLSTRDAPKGKFILKALDHGHCLGGPSASAAFLRKIDNIKLDRHYGLFPEFPAPDLRIVEETLSTIVGLPRSALAEILAELPPEWGFGGRENVEAVVRFLVDRGEFLHHELVNMLPQQGGLEL